MKTRPLDAVDRHAPRRGNPADSALSESSVDALRYLFRNLRREPRQFLRPFAAVLLSTLALLAGLLVLRSLIANRLPELANLLSTFDTVLWLLSATFLVEVALAALSFEILKLEARGEEKDR